MCSSCGSQLSFALLSSASCRLLSQWSFPVFFSHDAQLSLEVGDRVEIEYEADGWYHVSCQANKQSGVWVYRPCWVAAQHHVILR